jgi:nucleoside-diphosphate-sugar epimerase
MSDFLELMHLALSKEAPTGIFNVSTGEGHTIAEVFCAVMSCLGVSLPEAIPVVPPNDYDVPNLVLDPYSPTKHWGGEPSRIFRCDWPSDPLV